MGKECTQESLCMVSDALILERVSLFSKLTLYFMHLSVLVDKHISSPHVGRNENKESYRISSLGVP